MRSMLQNIAISSAFLAMMGFARADLVAHYTFDNAADLGGDSGSANVPLTPATGGTAVTGLFAGGMDSGTAAEFWTSSFGNADTYANSFTLSMQVKSGNVANWSDYISLLSANGNYFVLEATPTGTAFYEIKPDNSNASFIATAANLRDNTWHHLGLVSTGGLLELYVDGVFNQSTAMSNTSEFTGLQVSSRLGGGHRMQNAIFDDIGIWNEALSAADMATVAATGVASLNAVPEPATLSLTLLALACASFRRRRV